MGTFPSAHQLQQNHHDKEAGFRASDPGAGDSATNVQTGSGSGGTDKHSSLSRSNGLMNGSVGQLFPANKQREERENEEDEEGDVWWLFEEAGEWFSVSPAVSSVLEEAYGCWSEEPEGGLRVLQAQIEDSPKGRLTYEARVSFQSPTGGPPLLLPEAQHLRRFASRESPTSKGKSRRKSPREKDWQQEAAVLQERLDSLLTRMNELACPGQLVNFGIVEERLAPTSTAVVPDMNLETSAAHHPGEIEDCFQQIGYPLSQRHIANTGASLPSRPYPDPTWTWTTESSSYEETLKCRPGSQVEWTSDQGRVLSGVVSEVVLDAISADIWKCRPFTSPYHSFPAPSSLTTAAAAATASTSASNDHSNDGDDDNEIIINNNNNNSCSHPNTSRSQSLFGHCRCVVLSLDGSMLTLPLEQLRLRISSRVLPQKSTDEPSFVVGDLVTLVGGPEEDCYGFVVSHAADFVTVRRPTEASHPDCFMEDRDRSCLSTYQDDRFSVDYLSLFRHSDRLRPGAFVRCRRRRRQAQEQQLQQQQPQQQQQQHQRQHHDQHQHCRMPPQQPLGGQPIDATGSVGVIFALHADLTVVVDFWNSLGHVLHVNDLELVDDLPEDLEVLQLLRIVSDRVGWHELMIDRLQSS